MTLHLVYGWHYLGSLQQMLSLGDCKVRYSDGLDQPLTDKLLHGLKSSPMDDELAHYSKVSPHSIYIIVYLLPKLLKLCLDHSPAYLLQ